MPPRVASVEITRLQIAAVLPHPQNPRSHPKPGSVLWAVMRRSLEHDYFDPLVWNRRNGLLVSGHLRLKVLEELGFTEVDVSVVDYGEPTHLARMIAANRPLGEFEEAILASLAGEIEVAGLDAALAGMDHRALLALLDCPPVPDDTQAAEELVSKAEELLAKWQVKEGDHYRIGSHALLCGDCASADNWARLLPDGLADIAWWDPPYNVAYDASQRKRNAMRPSTIKPQKILNDDLSASDYLAKLHAWFAAGTAALKPGGAVYIAHADLFGLETRTAAKAAGIYLAQTLIWVKQAFTMGRQDYHWQHEPILYGWRSGAGHMWQGGYSHSTVIDEETSLLKRSKKELVAMINQLRNDRHTSVVREPRNTVSDLHPTVKPVGLVARHLWNSSRRGETVIELFGGSGTTLAAAEHTGRRCVATELEPKFCAVILERLSLLGLAVEKLGDRCQPSSQT